MTRHATPPTETATSLVAVLSPSPCSSSVVPPPIEPLEGLTEGVNSVACINVGGGAWRVVSSSNHNTLCVWDGVAGGAADAGVAGEAQAVSVAAPSDAAVLEAMEWLVESLDGAAVDAACLLQRRMLQQLLEARAVAAEAFLTASGDLHHDWQGGDGVTPK